MRICSHVSNSVCIRGLRSRMGKAVSSQELDVTSRSGATSAAGTAQPGTGTQEGQRLQEGCAMCPPPPELLGMFCQTCQSCSAALPAPALQIREPPAVSGSWQAGFFLQSINWIVSYFSFLSACEFYLVLEISSPSLHLWNNLLYYCLPFRH